MNLKVLIIMAVALLIEQSLDYNKKLIGFRNVLNKIFKMLFIVDICYFVLIYLGLNNVNKINVFVKNAINIFATNEDTIKHCQSIKNSFLFFKYIAKDIFIYYMFYKIFKYISYSILNIIQKLKFKKEIIKNSKDELYKNLYHYFSNKNDVSPILILGGWGSGKTYTINNFIDKYYRYSSRKIINNQKIYKISCFSITTKENFLKTIRIACENEDNGIFNKILSIIEKIPIIGNFLKKVLEKKYDINSLNKNAIFIFDNFERIAPYIEVVDDNGELITIKDEYDVLSKYNIVTSTIDELIEKYNMKVIILADDTMMIPNYIQDTFIFKLGCKCYNVKKSNTIFKEVWNEIISCNRKLQNYEKQIDIIFNQIKYTAQEIWEATTNENVRILQKSLYNFLFFYVYLLENNYTFDKENNEILGIFYTNLIVNISENSNFFKEIKIGQNISEYANHIINQYDEEFDGVLLFRTLNVMWYARKNDYMRWKNLEQNYKYIMNSLKEIKRACNYSYITKFNYKNKKIEKGKRINFDILCKIIQYNEEDSLYLAKEILKKSKITFKHESNYNINYVDHRKIFYINDMIKEYDITQILKDNMELLKLLFKMFEKEIDKFSINLDNMLHDAYFEYELKELSTLIDQLNKPVKKNKNVII